MPMSPSTPPSLAAAYRPSHRPPGGLAPCLPSRTYTCRGAPTRSHVTSTPVALCSARPASASAAGGSARTVASAASLGALAERCAASAALSEAGQVALLQNRRVACDHTVVDIDSVCLTTVISRVLSCVSLILATHSCYSGGSPLPTALTGCPPEQALRQA